MPTISESGIYLRQVKKVINETQQSKNLTEQGKLEKYKEIDQELKRLHKGWLEEYEQSTEGKRKQLESEAESLKKRVLERELSTDEITKLEYQAKTMLSKLAAEGKDGERFVALIKDYVNEGTNLSRQAFIDNYYEFAKLAERFDHNGADQLSAYHRRAENMMITPERKAYEDKLQELADLNYSKPSELVAAETNIREMTSVFSSKLWAAQNEEDEIPYF